MEIEGKLLKAMPVQNITSQKGQMKKLEFIIEIESKYPRKVCFELWNDKIDMLTAKAGEKIKVSFDLESREYNNRWFTVAKAWKVEKASATEQQDIDIPAMKEDVPSSFSATKEEQDDLPF